MPNIGKKTIFCMCDDFSTPKRSSLAAIMPSATALLCAYRCARSFRNVTSSPERAVVHAIRALFFFSSDALACACGGCGETPGASVTFIARTATFLWSMGKFYRMISCLVLNYVDLVIDSKYCRVTWRTTDYVHTGSDGSTAAGPVGWVYRV